MEEEFCSDGQLLVAVNGDGNICGIQRLGSSAVEPEMVTEMLEVYLAVLEFETNFPLLSPATV